MKPDVSDHRNLSKNIEGRGILSLRLASMEIDDLKLPLTPLPLLLTPQPHSVWRLQNFLSNLREKEAVYSSLSTITPNCDHFRLVDLAMPQVSVGPISL